MAEEGRRIEADAATGEPEESLKRAIEIAKRGDLPRAEAMITGVLSTYPEHVGALRQLAVVFHARGKKKEAVDVLRRAVSWDHPNDPEIRSEFGVALAYLGDRQSAAKEFERVLQLKPDDAWTHANLGAMYQGDQRLDDALRQYHAALSIDQHLLNARLNLYAALKTAVPPWHFPMMNDAPRNELYDSAVRRIVPGRSVLDIGTGAGLLAMMAARAGAKWVASCEIEPWVAEKSREIVALNGFSDKIRLVSKRSTDLRVGSDLPARAEVLITEVFGTTGINEDVIPTIEHAHEHLLVPGATVVPQGAVIRAYLAGGPALEGYFFAEQACGFVVAPFNEFAPPKVGLNASHVPHEILSDDVDILRFDLRQNRLPAEDRVLEVTATRAGRCFGLVQWLRLDLADGIVYENRPNENALIDSWGHMLYRFPEPVMLNPGDQIRLLAQHNRRVVLISRLC